MTSKTATDARATAPPALPRHKTADAPKVAPQRRAAASRSSSVLVLHALALRHQRFRAAATAVVGKLARQLDCDRVSLAFYAPRSLKISALSDTVDIKDKQTVVSKITAAMNESIAQSGIVMHPMPGGSSDLLNFAHAELSRVTGHPAICTIPIQVDNKLVGAFCIERTQAFDKQAVDTVKDAALFIGPILEMKRRSDLPVFRRLVQAMTPRSAEGHWFWSNPWRMGAALLSTLLLVAAVWPATFQVVAPARIEGNGQRIVAAPVEGFVKSTELRPGATVTKGQILATLDDEDLLVEKERWRAEIAKLDKEYRDAFTKDDAAAAVILRSKLEQATVNLNHTVNQIERIKLRAPFDGVLISGDLSQSLGMPVQRGQALMTVAPDNSFRIVAEIDEQEVSDLEIGQLARVLFAGEADHTLQATIERISPVSKTLNGQNIFEVDARLEQSPDVLRHGLRGMARIDVSRSTLGAIWWHRAKVQVRRLLWRWLG